MGDKSESRSITVLSFGPLAETLGRTRSISLDATTTCRQIIVGLGIENWLENGLNVAINGEMADLEAPVSPGDELALLPPVSGG
jgi:molybdopterin converting factor small subunit|tara:strand:- start:1089 stop:1340 length:252 start_codon:yes stop_codon:yes gene_type:complete